MDPPAARIKPWLRRVLVPFWIIQLLFMGILIAVLVWVASSVRAIDPHSYGRDGILILIICAVCLILCVTEIVLFARKSLATVTYLSFQVVKTGLWFIIFILNIVGIKRIQFNGSYNRTNILLGGIVETVIVLVSYIATLIYGAVLHHRHRHSRYSYRAQPIPSLTVAGNSRSAHNGSYSSASYGYRKGPFTEGDLVIPRYDDSPRFKAPLEELSAAGAVYELQSSNERRESDKRETRF